MLFRRIFEVTKETSEQEGERFKFYVGVLVFCCWCACFSLLLSLFFVVVLVPKKFVLHGSLVWMIVLLFVRHDFEVLFRGCSSDFGLRLLLILLSIFE